MRRVLLKILIFLAVAALAAWLLYPTVADQLARKGYLEKEDAYLKAVRELSSETIEKMLEDADTANNAIEEDIQPGDVFTARAERSSNKYRNLLNFHEGMIGQLEIPSIHVSLPIVHIGTEEQPDTKLVHVEGSSLPGETGDTHTVLAGPRKQRAPGFLGSLALTGDRMLEDLDRVTPGDQMMILLGNRTLLYEVRGVQTLSPEGLRNWTAERDPEEDRLTLITERDGRRLLVEAVRIPIKSAKEALQAGDEAKLPADWVTILTLGSPVFILVLLLILLIERIRRRFYRLPGEAGRRELRAEEENFAETAEKTSGKQNLVYNEEKPNEAEHGDGTKDEKKDETKDGTAPANDGTDSGNEGF